MKLLTTSTGSFLTGDDISDAVMRYSLTLAKSRDVDIVDVPFVADDGAVRRVDLIVGWQIGTTAITATARAPELSDADTTRDLRRRTEDRHVPHSGPMSAADAERMTWWLLDADELI